MELLVCVIVSYPLCHSTLRRCGWLYDCISLFFGMVLIFFCCYKLFTMAITFSLIHCKWLWCSLFTLQWKQVTADLFQCYANFIDGPRSEAINLNMWRSVRLRYHIYRFSTRPHLKTGMKKLTFVMDFLFHSIWFDLNPKPRQTVLTLTLAYSLVLYSMKIAWSASFYFTCIWILLSNDLLFSTWFIR